MKIQDYIDYSDKLCEHYKYPEEAKKLFLYAMKKMCESKYKAELFDALDKYARGKNINFGSYLCEGRNGDKLCNRFANEMNISPYTADFVFYLFFMPHLEKRYERAVLDKEMYYGAMNDFWCKLWECKRVYGVFGTFVGGWFGRWFRVDRFAIGRLQFEYEPHIWTMQTVKSPSGKTSLVMLWQGFVNIHIPSSGPLNHDEVMESYKKAYEFFKKRFIFGKVCFHTSSWLLSPDHREMLGEGSNIVKFSKDFKVINVGEESNFEDFWRIFNRPYNPQSPDTSGESKMQKGYARLLKTGGKMKHASGIFVYDGKEFYK